MVNLRDKRRARATDELTGERGTVDREAVRWGDLEAHPFIQKIVGWVKGQLEPKVAEVETAANAAQGTATTAQDAADAAALAAAAAQADATNAGNTASSALSNANAAQADATQALSDAAAVGNNLAANYDTALEVDAKLTTLQATIENPLGSSVGATLANDYYTAADTDLAIAGADTALRAAIEDPAGTSVGADLATNYYTIAQADSAISGATTTLKAEIEDPAGTSLGATLSTGYYTIAQTDSAIAGSITTYDAGAAGVASITTVIEETDGFATAFSGLTATVDGSGNISGFKATTWADPNGSGGGVLELLGDVIVPGTLSANRLTVGLQANDFINSDFMAPLAPNWVEHASDSGAGAATTLSINSAGDPYAWGSFPTLSAYQNDGSTTGFYKFTCRPVQDIAGTLAPGFAVTPGERVSFSARVSAHRCEGSVEIQWYDGAGSPLPSKNLITHTEEFDDSAWFKVGAGIASAPVVTANAGTSPRGTSNAARVQLALNGGTAAGDRSDLRFNPFVSVTGAPYVFSIWMKSFDGTPYDVQINLNGSADTPPPSVKTVTGEWQRFWVKDDVAVDDNRDPIVRLRGGEGTSDSADILVWGAQVERGLEPTDYERVNADGISEGIASNLSTSSAGPVGSDTNPDLWDLCWLLADAPALAAYYRPIFRKGPSGSGDANSEMFVARPMHCRVHGSATTPTPYSPEGTTLIDGDRILTGSVTADKITVASLDALSANLGTIEVGTANIADAAINSAKLAGTIESDNFVAGTSGWRINKNGDAEFQSVTLREIVDSDIAVGAVSETYGAEIGPTALGTALVDQLTTIFSQAVSTTGRPVTVTATVTLTPSSGPAETWLWIEKGGTRISERWESGDYSSPITVTLAATAVGSGTYRLQAQSKKAGFSANATQKTAWSVQCLKK